MIKRYILLLIILLPMFSQAQRWKRMRYEIVAAAGTTNFLGELGGANQIGTNYYKDLEMATTRYALNIGMRYKLSQSTAVKVGFSYGRLRGDDKYTQEPYRNNRNLMFKSPIVEIAAQYEFSWMKETIGSRYKVRRVRGRGKKGSDIYVYGFFGIAGYYFNPKAQLNGQWTALAPLNTEGQTLVATRPDYSRFQFAIPLGIGLKYSLNKTSSIGLEYGIRKVFTDYIDDVSTTYYDKSELAQNFGDASAQLSDPAITGNGGTGGAPGPFGGCQTCAGQQRGDPRDLDHYMFFLITYNYKLKTTRKGLPKF
ncbi:MAG: hypothetical protein POELPBGB_01741 [Bacteroidia bacterium]|nr:hypothetical protein [Bacteroidia bacterium]